MKPALIPVLVCYLLMFACADLQAQFVEHNRIFVMDVTKSMIGYNGNQNVWKEVKASMVNQIQYAPMDNGKIVIIPFQDGVIQSEIKQFDNNEKGKAEALAFVQAYEIPDAVTNTNICEAWDYSLNMFMGSERQNIFYVFTDGKQNVDYQMDGRAFSKEDCLNEVIKKYCRTSTAGKDFTFFISYRPDLLRDSELNSLESACENLAFDKPSGDKIFRKIVYLTARNDQLNFSLQNMHSANLGFHIIDKPANLSFSAQLEIDQELPAGTLLALTKFDGYGVDENNEATFRLRGIPSLDAVSKGLDSGALTGKIILSNPKGANARAYFTKGTSEVDVVISNKKVKTLTIKVLED